MKKPKPAAKSPAPAKAGAPRVKPASDATATGIPVSPDQLTPEEQMERFAKELKENDWGHQPC